MRATSSWAAFGICLILANGQARAGAWTQPKDGYYFKVSTNYLDTSSDIDASGSRIPKAGQGNLRDISTFIYIEYGLSDRLTLVTSLPYRRLSDRRIFETGIARERRSGFGDTEIRARWAISTGRTPISFAVGTKLSLWRPEGTTRVPLSTGEADFDTRILVGRSLHPRPVYTTGELGYRLRGGAFSDELFYSFEAGISARRFSFKGLLNGTQTLGDCEPMGEVGLIGDQNILKISPGVIYALNERLEISLELIHTATGCNTTAGSVLSLGIAIKP